MIIKIVSYTLLAIVAIRVLAKWEVVNFSREIINIVNYGGLILFIFLILYFLLVYIGIIKKSH